MSNDVDLSTVNLERWLSWGISEPQCRPVVVEALIRELLQERERSIAAEHRFTKMMSDMEIQRAKQLGQSAGKPKYQDGVKYETPSQRPIGPDGFPVQGFIF